jgi:plasmid replication initiation protein
VLNRSLVLTILTGGLERWLYRLVRKHGGHQRGGWSFDFKYLHAKSGSLSPLKHFTYNMREIVRRERLPGYRLRIERGLHGAERLHFTPIPVDALASPLRRRGLATTPGENL